MKHISIVTLGHAMYSPLLSASLATGDSFMIIITYGAVLILLEGGKHLASAKIRGEVGVDQSQVRVKAHPGPPSTIVAG